MRGIKSRVDPQSYNEKAKCPVEPRLNQSNLLRPIDDVNDDAIVFLKPLISGQYINHKVNSLFMSNTPNHLHRNHLHREPTSSYGTTDGHVHILQLYI